MVAVVLLPSKTVLIVTGFWWAKSHLFFYYVFLHYYIFLHYYVILHYYQIMHNYAFLPFYLILYFMYSSIYMYFYTIIYFGIIMYFDIIMYFWIISLFCLIKNFVILCNAYLNWTVCAQIPVVRLFTKTPCTQLCREVKEGPLSLIRDTCTEQL